MANLKNPTAPYHVSDLGLFRGAGFPRRQALRLSVGLNSEHKAWNKQRDTLQTAIGSGFLIALLGKRGTGKTQLALHAAAVCAVNGRSIKYVRAMDVFLRIRETYADPDLTEIAVVDEFCSPQLLVVDEVQERGDTEFEGRILNYLIDRRYGDMTDTLVVGNLTGEAFHESLGSSITDRLRETGGIIECNWDSFRESN
ncbi:MAG: ATP-binding protein [Phycisphaerae bacterium]